MLKEKSLGKC